MKTVLKKIGMGIEVAIKDFFPFLFIVSLAFVLALFYKEAKEIPMWIIILLYIILILQLTLAIQYRRKKKKVFNGLFSQGTFIIMLFLIVAIISFYHLWNIWILVLIPGLAFVLDKYTKHLPKKT